MKSNSRTSKNVGSSKKGFRGQKAKEFILSPPEVADTQCTLRKENSIASLKELSLSSESLNKTIKESNSQEYDPSQPSNSNSEQDCNAEPFVKGHDRCKAVKQTILRLELDLTSIDKKLNAPLGSSGNSLHGDVYALRSSCLFVLERISVFQINLLDEDFEIYSSSESQLKRLENKCYDLIKVCDDAASKRIVGDCEDQGLSSNVSCLVGSDSAKVSTSQSFVKMSDNALALKVLA